jgi:hypothetical protein
MPIDFEKIATLRKELYWEVAQATDYCLNTQQRAMMVALNNACRIATEIENQTIMDKIAGA